MSQRKGESKYEKEVNRYMKAIRGEGFKGRYKNSDLYLLEDSEETIEEKTKNAICPPLHLNPEFYKPGKTAKPSAKTPRQTPSRQTPSRQTPSRQYVDPNFLREINMY